MKSQKTHPLRVTIVMTSQVHQKIAVIATKSKPYTFLSVCIPYSDVFVYIVSRASTPPSKRPRKQQNTSAKTPASSDDAHLLEDDEMMALHLLSGATS